MHSNSSRSSLGEVLLNFVRTQPSHGRNFPQETTAGLIDDTGLITKEGLLTYKPTQVLKKVQNNDDTANIDFFESDHEKTGLALPMEQEQQIMQQK